MRWLKRAQNSFYSVRMLKLSTTAFIICASVIFLPQISFAGVFGTLKCNRALLPELSQEQKQNNTNNLFLSPMMDPHSSVLSDWSEETYNSLTPEGQALLYDAVYLPRMINTHKYRGGAIDEPMVAVLPELSIIKAGDHGGERYQLKSNLGNVDTLVWRGDYNSPLIPEMITLSDSIPGHNFVPNVRTVNLKKRIKDTLKQLYESFRRQGPERQVLAPEVEKQDNRDLERTTHFQVSMRKSHRSPNESYIETGHLQIMTSKDESEPLHFEEQWGAQIGKIERFPGEIIGEAGRYNFLLGDEFDKAHPNLSSDEKYFLRLMIWTKMLAWANHDIKLDRMYFQVNGRVRDKLIAYGIPLDKLPDDKVRDVKATYGNEVIHEYVFELDRKMLLLTEQNLTRNILRIQLQAAVASGGPEYANFDTMTVSLKRNQIWALINLGLIEVEQKEYDDYRQFIPATRAETLYADQNSAVPFKISKSSLATIDLVNLRMSKDVVEKILKALSIL